MSWNVVIIFKSLQNVFVNLLYDEGQVKMNIGGYVLIPRNNPKKSIYLNITKDTDPQRLFNRATHFLS